MYDGSVGKSLGGCHKQRRQNRFRGDEKRPPFTFVVGHMSDPKSSQLQSRKCICHPKRAESRQTAGDG